jgi:hypothetical protein
VRMVSYIPSPSPLHPRDDERATVGMGKLSDISEDGLYPPARLNFGYRFRRSVIAETGGTSSA